MSDVIFEPTQEDEDYADAWFTWDNNMEVTLNGYHWDTEDLFQCKNVVSMLVAAGYSREEIKEYESEGYFGSLWVDNVLEEIA